MLKEEIKNIKEEKSDLRKFGITVGIVFILISIALYLLSKNSYTYFGVLGILLLLLGLFLPYALKPLNKSLRTPYPKFTDQDTTSLYIHRSW